MSRDDSINVLLVDDSPEIVRIYADELEKLGRFKVIGETSSKHALRRAQNQLFDVLVIDARIPYRGLEFGGLRLADDLSSRYGHNSILIVSRFITLDLMESHGSQFEFMEKYNVARLSVFARDLGARIRAMIKQQYVFVAMPFDEAYAKLYSNHIKRAIRKSGLGCVRVDEIIHSGQIHKVIFKHIQNSKMVLFVADGGNPNAYYEAGFADAMGKEVIIVARSLSELRFDVNNRHTTTYEGGLPAFEEELLKKLNGIRRSHPLVL